VSKQSGGDVMPREPIQTAAAGASR